MQFSGYWLSKEDGYITLKHFIFDETELSSGSNWKEAWQNEDLQTNAWGYIDFNSAIRKAAQLIANSNQSQLSENEIDKLLDDDLKSTDMTESLNRLLKLSASYNLATLEDVKFLNALLLFKA